MALILFLQQKEMLPKSLHCTIVDKNIEWEETWEKIWENFPDKPQDFQIEVTYESCDLLETNDLPGDVIKAVSEAHIVTMITAYGGLYRSYLQNNRRSSPNKLPRLKMICEKMAKESVMLFIDKENRFHYETVFWKNHAEPADMNRVLEPSPCTYRINNYWNWNWKLGCPSIKRFIQHMPKHLMLNCRVKANLFEHKKRKTRKRLKTLRTTSKCISKKKNLKKKSQK